MIDKDEKRMLEWIDGQILGQEQLTGDLIKTHDLLWPDEQKNNEPIMLFAKEDIAILHAIRVAIENSDKGPEVDEEWFERLAKSILYHEGTNEPAGIKWPVAKAMLREVGVWVN